MTDEKFTFVEDVKEKKMASRSARNRITHTGKGGKVRFPHDNLTRKELEAMNGELRVYRMNDPMKWEDFKTMPVDLQVQYIKAIRNRRHVSDSCIARMMGVNQSHFSHHARKIGVALGRGSGNQRSDKDGFLAWCSGAKESKISGDAEESREISSAPDGEVCETAAKNEAHVADEVELDSCIFPSVERIQPPISGRMLFEDRIDNALKTVAAIIGTEYKYRITIKWDRIFNEGEKIGFGNQEDERRREP